MEPIVAGITFIDSESGRTYQVRHVKEDALTDDASGRYVVGPVGWRDGRLPFTFSDVEGEPHEEARYVASALNFRREDIEGETWVVSDLDWDDDELALEAKRLVDEDRITGVSIHPAEGEGYILCGVPPKGSSADDVKALAERFDPEGCDPQDWVEAWTNLTIASSTLLMTPAFADAVVVVAGSTTARFPSVKFDSELDSVGESWVPDLTKPPRDWFTGNLEEPTPLTITEDGQVFGHLALWETCHRGFEGQCITPPRSFTEYAQFHENAKLTTQEGESIGVGCLTFDVSHADTRSSLNVAKKHYDHTGTVFAFVRAGEDDFGVWVAGAIRPDLDSAKVETLRRLSLSGDWRPKDGEYHLIAAQAVPVPGFPVKSLVAGGSQIEFNTVGPTNIPPSMPQVLVMSKEDADSIRVVSDTALVAAAVQILTDEVRELRQVWEDERNLREYEAALAIFAE